MFKYAFGIKITLLESLWNQKSPLKGIVFYRTDFLRVVGAPNVTLRLIIISYMFEYTFGIKTTLLESLRNEKNPLKARFRHNFSKGLSFCA